MIKKGLLILSLSVVSLFSNQDFELYVQDSNDRILNRNINDLTLIQINRDLNKKIITNKVVIDSSKIVKENFGETYYQGNSVLQAELSQLLKQNLVKNICLSNIGLLRNGFKIHNEIKDISNVVDTTIYVKLKDCVNY